MDKVNSDIIGLEEDLSKNIFHFNVEICFNTFVEEIKKILKIK